LRIASLLPLLIAFMLPMSDLAPILVMLLLPLVLLWLLSALAWLLH
jgi:hypothetical protein